MKRIAVIGSMVMMVAACGSSTSGGLVDDSSDGGGATTTWPSDAGVPDDGASTSTLADARAVDGSADDRIDPIVVGNSWTYQVTTFGTYPLCPAGQYTGLAESAATVGGKSAVLVKSLCANEAASYYTVEGDVVQVQVDGTWVLALDAPVAEGHTWSNGTSTFTWRDAGAVTVAAGTFDDCWSATQNVAYEAYTIFCRGVGPVRWHSKDGAGDGFDAELASASVQ